MSELNVRSVPTKQVDLVQVPLGLDCHPGMKYQSLRKVRGLPVEELSHTECQGLSERGGIHTGKCSSVGSQRKNRARSVFLGRESLV